MMDKILLFLRLPDKRVKLSLLSMMVALLTTHCVTTKPPLAELQRFDLTKEEVPTSELDRIYDNSRLKVGDSAILRSRIIGSYLRPRSSVYVTNKEVIAIDDLTQNYIVDVLHIWQEGDGQLTTIELTPLQIRQVLGPRGYKVLKVSEVKSDELDPITKATFKSLVTGGIVGFSIEVIPKLIIKHRSEAVTKRYSQVRKEYEDYHKIIKFDQLSDEELTVGARRILCRVYQIDMISKVMTVSSDRSEPFYTVSDASTKVWVSDDVPFGLVKLDSSSIIHHGAEEKPMEMTTNVELIDFKD